MQPSGGVQVRTAVFNAATAMRAFMDRLIEYPITLRDQASGMAAKTTKPP